MSTSWPTGGSEGRGTRSPAVLLQTSFCLATSSSETLCPGACWACSPGGEGHWAGQSWQPSAAHPGHVLAPASAPETGEESCVRVFCFSGVKCSPTWIERLLIKSQVKKKVKGGTWPCCSLGHVQERGFISA